MLSRDDWQNKTFTSLGCRKRIDTRTMFPVMFAVKYVPERKKAHCIDKTGYGGHPKQRIWGPSPQSALSA